MVRPLRCLLLATVVTACGGESSESQTSSKGADIDACALLTAEEIQAAAGWTPVAPKGETYGSTKTCSYVGPNAMTQTIALVVARPAPKVSTSAELAARRNEAAKREPSIKMVITPIEGLGKPAVRSDVEGGSTATVEVVVGRHLLAVGTSDFEVAKALASKALARMP
jgi:hypothetical protein